MVCEDHPEAPWEGVHGTVEGHAEHGGIGMPCPACCSPVPEDGTRDIAEAFIPDWQRAGDRLPAVALEPDTLPNHPLRASDVPALLPKEIGLQGRALASPMGLRGQVPRGYRAVEAR
jgi:hypothetical protein